MSFPAKFPRARMRRNRRDAWSRDLVSEHSLSAKDLIYPVFVTEGSNQVVDVPSMPGVCRYSIDRLLPVAENAARLGIPLLAIFPVIEADKKTPDGREAANPAGLVPRAVQALKKHLPELGVMTDVALDPYTSHGQDSLMSRAESSTTRL